MYNLTDIIAKSEEIRLRWGKDGWSMEKWYEQNGIDPIREMAKGYPNDQELEKMLKKEIEDMKNKDKKITKLYNEDFWLYQMAAMRALREDARKFCEQYELKTKTQDDKV